MYPLLTKDNIQFAIYLIGIIFVVYKSYEKPQVRIDQEIELLKAELINLKENHIHSLIEQTKINNQRMVSFEKKITRLATIIEERIPRK